MAITYPRDMICGVETVEFDIARFVASNALYGGKTQVREMAEPRWRASFSYAGMRRLEFQAVEAWLSSLRGGTRDFYAHDPLKPYPVSYRGGFTGQTRHGGGAFNGTGTVTAIAASGFTVATLPSTFALKAGDMVGLTEGTKRGLYRILEDATASAGAVALAVEPRVNTALFTTAATANLAKPVCIMTLEANSISASRSAYGMASPLSFSAIQKVQ